MKEKEKIRREKVKKEIAIGGSALLAVSALAAGTVMLLRKYGKI